MKKNVRMVLTGVMLLGVILIITGCGAGKGNDQKSEENKILKVGMDATYAPFEFKDLDGTISGFDAELIKAMGEVTGYEVELSHVEWKDLDSFLSSGQIDIVISAVTITEERKLDGDFSKPYFESSQIIAVRDDSKVEDLSDLAGLTIGVQANTTGQYVCEDAGISEEKIVKYPNASDALMNLSNGSIDAVVADAPVVMNYIVTNSETKFKTVTDDFEKEYYGIKVKKGNRELLEQINSGLKIVQENGKFDEIYHKYFGK